VAEDLKFDGESEVARRLASLTPRERKVFERMILGLQNKQIAHFLKISERTVEVHRSRVLAKMQSQNLPMLIRMTIAAGVTKPTGADHVLSTNDR
jgi:FixJ family two-component response regulator